MVFGVGIYFAAKNIIDVESDSEAIWVVTNVNVVIESGRSEKRWINGVESDSGIAGVIAREVEAL